MNFQWKKINKRNGNIKRACKKKYLQMLASDVENVCCISRPETKKQPDKNSFIMEAENLDSENICLDNSNDILTLSSDENNEENEQLLSEAEKIIEIRSRLITWATSYNINHSALRELFTILNEAIPNCLPKDPRTLLRTPKSIVLVSLENGTYWHNGFISVLGEALNSLDNISNIKIIFPFSIVSTILNIFDELICGNYTKKIENDVERGLISTLRLGSSSCSSKIFYKGCIVPPVAHNRIKQLYCAIVS